MPTFTTHEKFSVIWISGYHSGKSSIFWDISPCGPVDVHLCFGGTYCLLLLGISGSLLLAGYLLGLFFDPEDGGSMFLQDVREFIPANTGLHPRT
jgi:hypothetical protein